MSSLVELETKFKVALNEVVEEKQKVKDKLGKVESNLDSEKIIADLKTELWEDFKASDNNLKDSKLGMAVFSWLEKLDKNCNAMLSSTKESGGDPLQGCISKEDALAKINFELEKFSSDKLGMSDYALSSLGGHILYKFTSPAYVPPTKNVFGKLVESLWPSSKSANVILEPDTSLGNCFACKLPTCNVTVKIAAPVKPTAFSLDHVAYSVALNLESAPREFAVYGLGKEEGEEFLLGNFEYKFSKTSSQVQTFQVAEEYLLNKEIDTVKLAVLSNYGSPTYTCIYRFRVHMNRGK